MKAQADLNLCWVHMSKGTFSDVAASILIKLLLIFVWHSIAIDKALFSSERAFFCLQENGCCGTH